MIRQPNFELSGGVGVSDFAATGRDYLKSRVGQWATGRIEHHTGARAKRDARNIVHAFAD
jgi:hypothetical protein